MHERALSVNLDPQIEAECIHDLSQHCSDLTAKSQVRSLLSSLVFSLLSSLLSFDYLPIKHFACCQLCEFTIDIHLCWLHLLHQFHLLHVLMPPPPPTHLYLATSEM